MTPRTRIDSTRTGANSAGRLEPNETRAWRPGNALANPSARSAPRRFPSLLTLAGLLAALASAAGFTWWMVARADDEMRAELLQQTQLLGKALNADNVKTLTGTKADLETPVYQQIKQQLAAVRSANSHCRFVYLMGRKPDGTVFFFVDSEPPESKDYSPPGQVYEDASAACHRVFDTGASAVEGPVADRWGDWVSTMVPVSDGRTGSMIALLGMDVDARDWKWTVAARSALPVGLMLVLLVGAAAAFTLSRRVTASPKLVLRRLLWPLTAVAAIVAVGTGTLLWQQNRHALIDGIAARVSDVSAEFHAIVKQQASGLSAAVKPIAADPAVRKALREGDAAGLLAAWRPLFESLHKENRLTHFYFLDKDRLCLARLHKPEKRGDVIDRFTALEAQRTGKTASGIELGPMGTFTLRVVQPVFEGGSLVGYVELGKEIEDVLRTLHASSGNQLAVTIRKDRLTRQAWEDGMRMLGREADWDRLPQSALIYASQGRLPDGLSSWADHHVHGESDRELLADGTDWWVSAVPLEDVSGAEVGDLLIMRDMTGAKMAFARLMTLGGAAGAVLLSLLIAFIYVLLHRADAGIRAQHAVLQESEKRFSDVLHSSSDAILLIEDATFVDCNEAATRMLGYADKRELLDTHPSELSPPVQPDSRLSADKADEMMATALKEGSHRFEWMHRKAGGEDFLVDVTLTAIAVGGKTQLHCVWRDRTERHRSQVYAEMGREILQILNEPGDMPDSVRRILGTLKARTGFDAVGIRLQHGEDFPYVAQEGFSQEFLLKENLLAECNAAGGKCRGTDGRVSLECTCGLVVSGKTDPACPLFTPGGSFWTSDSIPLLDIRPEDDPRHRPRNTCMHQGYASMALVPIRCKERIVGLIQFNDRRKGCFTLGTVELLEGIASHIGAAMVRKQAETELLETNRQLEQAVGRANEMAVLAETASVTKSEFLANMSHEIRTPLTAILGYSELMMEEGATPQERQEHSRVILRNSRHLLELVNDILDISKIEADKLVLERRRCSIHAIVADVVSMMRVRAIEKNLALTARYITPIPETILTDEARLRQAIINLVGNAVKFTEAGEVSISVGLVQDSPEGAPALRIDVRDTGIGMSPDTIAQLFQPFMQADSSTTRKYGGTGLGLTITRRIMEKMEGRILVESVPGQGSTFSLLVPTGPLEGVALIRESVEAMTDAAEAPRQPEPTHPLKTLRILLAEDGPDNQVLIRTLLANAGAEVEVVANGLLAVQAAARQTFDLVLMDMQMPEMDGYQAAGRLRAQGYAVPIVALTAHTLSGDRQRCLDAGCTGYLSKPIQRAAMIDLILEQAASAPPHPEPRERPPQAVRSEFADDQDLVDVIEAFVGLLPQRCQAMRETLGNNDLPTLAHLAHQMKGAGGSYGYPALTQAGAQLEAAAKAADREACQLHLASLAALCDAVGRGLSAQATAEEHAK
ncbi:MAG: ATP-binding protein [Planctomycetota bacterium]|nr:ATP-binding protein [Planctomycetota bacterium]